MKSQLPNDSEISRPVQNYRPQPTRILRWVVIFAAVVLISLQLIKGFPNEVSRWLRAAAQNAFLDQEFNDAIGWLDHAIDWAPDDGRLYLFRAEIRKQTSQLTESVADCTRAIELLADPRLALSLRSDVRQLLVQHEQAIADTNRIVEISEAERDFNSTGSMDLADALNNRAYVRARANMQIGAGLEDAKRALGDRVSPDKLDTRGYLHYLAGDYDSARRDMEAAVSGVQQDYAMLRSAILRQQKNLVDHRILDETLKIQEHRLAVLYQHRGLVYEKTGRLKKAQADFREAKKLGYSPAKGVW